MVLGKIAAASLATAAAGLAYSAAAQPASTFASSSSSSAPSALASRPADPDARRAQLAIYPRPDPPAVLVPVKSPLQDQVAAARLASADSLGSLAELGTTAKDRWLEWESVAENHVRSVLSPQDQLAPNALYVAVATLAGSILARNRGFLLRLALPPTFLLLATSHFLPHTWHNVATRSEQFEAAHLPQLRDLRTQLGVARK
ncbi:hypothetical protein JCM8097_002101 [Rhodosporidiobolus ruineniae]